MLTSFTGHKHQVSPSYYLAFILYFTRSFIFLFSQMAYFMFSLIRPPNSILSLILSSADDFAYVTEKKLKQSEESLHRLLLSHLPNYQHLQFLYSVFSPITFNFSKVSSFIVHYILFLYASLSMLLHQFSTLIMS